MVSQLSTFGETRLPGHLLHLIWQSEPHLDAAARYRRACRYDAFIPDLLRDLQLDLPATTAGMVSEAEFSVQALNAAANPVLAPFARLLLRSESIASSKVEGLQMDVRDLARAEARMDAGGRSSRTAEEIFANVAAMETAIAAASASPQITQADILAIHERLLRHEGVRTHAGQFRTRQNWIGGNDYNPCGADFVPPPPEHLPLLLADLCEAINDDVLPPLVQAAVVHAQFETIHPFDDGNGRTGRALVHVVLRRRGIAPHYVPPISIVLAGGKQRYINGLTAFRFDSIVGWIEHFAAATTHAALLAKRYVAKVDALMASWRMQVRKASAPRADAAAWAIIDVLPAHPMITASLAATSTQRSLGPIYDALEQLTAAGVLVPTGTSKRNRTWEAVGLIDLLEDLHATVAATNPTAPENP